MIRYLIKTTYVATERNNNFKGETQIWLHGEKGQSIKENDKLMKYFIKEYAYKRLCDAKRVLKNEVEYNKQEESLGFWKVKSEIVKYDL